MQKARRRGGTRAANARAPSHVESYARGDERTPTLQTQSSANALAELEEIPSHFPDSNRGGQMATNASSVMTPPPVSSSSTSTSTVTTLTTTTAVSALPPGPMGGGVMPLWNRPGMRMRRLLERGGAVVGNAAEAARGVVSNGGSTAAISQSSSDAHDEDIPSATAATAATTAAPRRSQIDRPALQQPTTREDDKMQDVGSMPASTTSAGVAPLPPHLSGPMGGGDRKGLDIGGSQKGGLFSLARAAPGKLTGGKHHKEPDIDLSMPMGGGTTELAMSDSGADERRKDEDLRSYKRRIIQLRRQSSHAPVTLQIGFRSRTGWEPLRSQKHNQDTIVAMVPVPGSDRFSLFAVLDGHGHSGHLVSMLVARHVSDTLSALLTRPGGVPASSVGKPTRTAIAQSMRRAILSADRKLMRPPPKGLECSISGTTGVFVVLDGAMMYCANVGDSRAVIGRTADAAFLLDQEALCIPSANPTRDDDVADPQVSLSLRSPDAASSSDAGSEHGSTGTGHATRDPPQVSPSVSSASDPLNSGSQGAPYNQPDVPRRRHRPALPSYSGSSRRSRSADSEGSFAGSVNGVHGDTSHGRLPTREELFFSSTPRMTSYTAVPLSFDHSPLRASEKARVQAAGGRVDAWESVDVGDERVWLPNKRTPGLAVTRSFGDSMLKPFGVSAEPEIHVVPLSTRDSFAILATDGVFDFISNQEVVAIVGQYRHRGTPQEAAEALVKTASERWIEDDSVIDDISATVVFLDVSSPAALHPIKPVHMPLVDTPVVQTAAATATSSATATGAASGVPATPSSSSVSGQPSAAQSLSQTSMSPDAPMTNSTDQQTAGATMLSATSVPVVDRIADDHQVVSSPMLAAPTLHRQESMHTLHSAHSSVGDQALGPVVRQRMTSNLETLPKKRGIVRSNVGPRSGGGVGTFAAARKLADGTRSHLTSNMPSRNVNEQRRAASVDPTVAALDALEGVRERNAAIGDDDSQRNASASRSASLPRTLVPRSQRIGGS